MLRILPTLVLTTWLLTASVFPQSNESIPTLSYKELINDGVEYVGKRVRVSGYWRMMFEMDVLYDPSEQDFRKHGAWLELDGLDDQCASAKKELRKIRKNFVGEVHVILTGKLRIGGGFGHMNGYKYMFDVDCVEKVTHLSKLRVKTSSP